VPEVLTVEHPFRTEIPLKTVKGLSPMAVANAAKEPSKLLI
jgi:hypothetical protein